MPFDTDDDWRSGVVSVDDGADGAAMFSVMTEKVLGDQSTKK
jgi:hypothetical protein